MQRSSFPGLPIRYIGYEKITGLQSWGYSRLRFKHSDCVTVAHMCAYLSIRVLRLRTNYLTVGVGDSHVFVDDLYKLR